MIHSAVIWLLLTRGRSSFYCLLVFVKTIVSSPCSLPDTTEMINLAVLGTFIVHRHPSCVVFNRNAALPEQEVGGGGERGGQHCVIPTLAVTEWVGDCKAGTA